VSDVAVTASSVLMASRALLGVVAHSLTPVLDRVTVPQFRVLVVLSTAAEPVRSGEVAAMLGIHPSTFTRTADRLVAGGWVVRAENAGNRRETLIHLTPEGRRLVDRVTADRRREISSILARVEPEDRHLILAGMGAFARAAGEPRVTELAEFGV
jgi:DNA-binding MarR family transcriptional regulator